jgi:hypothetical protein
MPANGADHHIVMMNTQSCQASELYQRYVLGTYPGTPTNSQGGVQYGLEYGLHGGADAAGMYLQPLSFRYSEIRDCVDRGIPIHHAGRFTLSNGYINSKILWPATSQTNENTVGLAYGERVRLRASFDASDPTEFNPAAVCIVNALKQYGLFLADGGDNFAISAMEDAQASIDTMIAIGGYPASGIQAISGTDLEVVDETSLEASADSGRVNPSNPYVMPVDSVTVVATATADPTMNARIPVVLQAVTVGTADHAKYVMAGTPGVQLVGWVNGSTNTCLTWSMSPALGALTPGGVYTAPASVMSPTTTTITATSAADPTRSTSFNLTVMPGPAIRVLGDAETGPSYQNDNVDYGPDAEGNVWWGGRGILPGAGRGVESTYYRGSCSYLTQCLWPTTTDIGEYFAQSGDAQDNIYRYSLPNGSYAVTLMFASYSPFSMGDFVFSVDSQGEMINPSVDLCTVIGSCSQFTPGQIRFTATVTDNSFYFAIRTLPSSKSAATYLNAFSVVPQ